MFVLDNEREICFSRPRRLTDVASWHVHIPFVFYLIQRQKPSMIVELGVHRGDSYSALCQAVDELGLSTVCYGVDTWKGDEHAGYYNDKIFQEFRTYHDPLYGRFSKLMRTTFDDACPYFSKKSIDLLHIDGRHFYDAVVHDFSIWVPKMTDRGIIMMHDIYVRERDFGVWRFWEELKEKYRCFELPHQHGLGIVCVGENIPQEIRSLADSSVQDIDTWSRFFYALGSSMNSDIPKLNAEIQEKNAEIQEKNAEIQQRNIQLGENIIDQEIYNTEFLSYEKKIEAKNAEIKSVEIKLASIEKTILWKISHTIYEAFDRMIPYNSKRRILLFQIFGLVKKIIKKIYSKSKVRAATDPLLALSRHGAEAPNSFHCWSYRNRLTQKAERLITNELSLFSRTPLFSFIIPVYKTPYHFLKKMLDSIQQQLYGRWEAYIIDDGSSCNYIDELLTSYHRDDSRFTIIRLQKNQGISAASNEGLKQAQGDYITFLDHDDFLEKDALLQIAKFLQHHPDADIIYTDNDRVGNDGSLHSPQFKPDWSPELLLSFCYVVHLKIFSKNIIKEIGYLSSNFEGSQDYDFLLRATETTNRIYHLPLTLYHWRETQGQQSTKESSIEAGRCAVAAALERRGFHWVSVEQAGFAKSIKNGIYQLMPNGVFFESVSIIITIRNNWELLKKCVESILSRSTHKNYEIIIVDDDSDDAETIAYLKTLDGNHRILWTKREKDKGFNYSKLCNIGAVHAMSEFLLFLNADIEVLTDTWMEEMLLYAKMPSVGVVGARLRFPDLTIQHAGVVKGFQDGLADHPGKGLSIDDPGYLFNNKVARNVSAVTGACLLIKKDLFNSLGKFDDVNLPIAFNDVDLCLRAVSRGLRCVYAPAALLLHLEGVIKGRKYAGNQPIRDVLYFKKRWFDYHDPFYNSNFSLTGKPNYQIAAQKNTRLSLFDLTTKPLTICSVSHDLRYGGAQRSKYHIDRFLHARGAKIHVLAAEGGPYLEWYKKEGIPVTVFETKWWDSFEAFRLLYNKILEYSQSLACDLVYANTLATAYAIEAAHTYGIPSIWNIRESLAYKHFFDWVDGTTQMMVDNTLSKANRLVFPCNATATLFKPYDRFGTSDVIYNGIESQDFEHLIEQDKNNVKKKLGLPSSKKVVSIIGITGERKGQLDFVHAALEILAKRNDVCFTIVGGRPSKSKYLEKLKIAANNHPDIHIIPETPDAHAYLRASDIFVCASYEEAFPRVILEAMIFSLPIITTPVFGVSEQIIHGKTGIFFDPGNVRHLAHYMNILLSNEHFAAYLGSNAREYVVTMFPEEQCLKKYETVMRTVALEDVNNPL